MITLIVGEPRSGKTYFTTCILLDRMRKDLGDEYKLISNVRGHVDADKLIPFPDDFMIDDYNRSIIVLDEVHKYDLLSDPREAKKLLMHFAEHGHVSRHYIWITQGLSMIPPKWKCFIERTYVIDPIAGGSHSYANCYLGVPQGVKVKPISSQRFKPQKNDRYQSIQVGEIVQKRRMAAKVWYLLAGFFFSVSLMIFLVVGVANDGFMGNSLNVDSITNAQAANNPKPINSGFLSNVQDRGRDAYLGSSVPSSLDIPSDRNLPVDVFAKGSMNLEDSLAYLSLEDAKDRASQYKKDCGNVFTDNPYFDCLKFNKRVSRKKHVGASLGRSALRRAAVRASNKPNDFRVSHYDYSIGQWVYE